ncbi:MAG: DUF3887 domain-containing protein [Clostridium sp.]|nr:DUF3887 domain-containing protein [Clostridium sp.]
MNQKAYMKAVSRQLTYTKTQKKEIIRQLESDIRTAMEQGETLEQVCGRMGTPKEVAKEFNENLPETELKRAKRGKTLRITTAAICIFLVLGLTGYWLFPKPIPLEESSVFEETQLEAKALAVISALDAEDYDTLQSEYADESMVSYLTREAMEQPKKTIAAEWGDQSSIGNTYITGIRQRGKEYAVVQINVGYENANVTYTLSFSPQYKLIGLYMR